MWFDQLCAHFNNLAKYSLPHCPDPIVQQLKNYDEIMNAHYSQLKSLVLFVKSHALLLGRKVVTEFDLVSIVICYEQLAGEKSAFDFNNEEDHEMINFLSSHTSKGMGVIFKTLKEYQKVATFIKNRLEDQQYKMFVTDDEEEF